MANEKGVPEYTGPTCPAKVRGRLREVQAIQLRLQGLTFDQIGARLGITGYGAHLALTRGLRRLDERTRESADLVRQEEALRLDALLAGVWERAVGGHLGSVAQVLRIMERRARLLGLDSPSVVSGVIGVEDLSRLSDRELDAELGRLLGGARAPRAGGGPAEGEGEAGG